VAGLLLKDLSATVEPMRQSLQGGTVDSVALAARVDALLRQLQQRRHELPEPASYSDQMAIARFRELSENVRGESRDVRIARAFLATAAAACDDAARAALRPDALCTQIRARRHRKPRPVRCRAWQTATRTFPGSGGAAATSAAPGFGRADRATRTARARPRSWTSTSLGPQPMPRR
jgi:hypothetical protein